VNHNWNGLEVDQLLISYDPLLERIKTDTFLFFSLILLRTFTLRGSID
jgi:hypothetical protein